MAQVKIGPEFFSKELREYSSWTWAYVREAFQNSIDAPRSSLIKFDVGNQDGNTIVTWSNDGSPMDLDTIENKLFSLGGTGKNCQGENVGGFGKAKTLLYFAHVNYIIKTGNLIIRGCGGDYTVETISEYYPGTISTVTIKGEHSAVIEGKAKQFVSHAQWSGSFVINGKPMKGNLHKGSLRRDLGFGLVYSNRSYSNLMIVRMKGIPMFTRYIRLDRCVVVELTGSSIDCMTSNRDDLQLRYSQVLSDFVTDLAVDKRSALSNRTSEKKVFDGLRLSYFSASLREASSLRVADTQEQSSSSEATDSELSEKRKREALLGDSSLDLIRSVLRDRFVLLNNTGYDVPAHYLPNDGKFSSYSRKLSKIWANLILELHRVFDRSAVFSVGFVFEHGDEDSPPAAAMFERDGQEHVYYINPAIGSNFKKRFKLTDRDLLLSYALHEFVHGSFGKMYHDEDFAATFTQCMAIVLKNRKRFNKCFVV